MECFCKDLLSSHHGKVLFGPRICYLDTCHHEKTLSCTCDIDVENDALHRLLCYEVCL